MKHLLACIAGVLLMISSFAQKTKEDNRSFYIYDGNWQPCQLEDAKFLVCMDKISDSSYQWRYYHFDGPLINIETYKDKDGTIPNGYFAYFDSSGRIDSCGYTFNRRKDSSWYYFNDSLKLWCTEKYNHGRLLERKDSFQLRKEYEVSSKETNDITNGDKESVFSGGIKSWIKYLQKRLEFPDRARNLGREGTVSVLFTIDTDGSTKNLFIYKSVEYSLDEECQRLIRISPRWEPAVRNGKRIKAYRIQPVTFKL